MLGLGEGEGSQHFMGMGSPFGADEHVLEMDGGDSTTTMGVHLCG